jgi:exonuclease III
MTVRALKKLIAKYQPDVVFLMETRQLSSNSSFLHCFKNNYNMNIVSCSTTGGGEAGGLALLWNKCTTDLTIINYDSNYIDCSINSHNLIWRATGIYGYPTNQNKLLTCNLISDLENTNKNDNWFVFGDFNLVLSSDEKKGGNPIDYNLTNAFRNTLNDCNLNDLGCKGNIFTWHNKQDEPHYIQARLDRFCASNNWIYNFSAHENNHLLRYGSDHCPIMLDFSTNPICKNINQQRQKRYEHMWTRDEEHMQQVQQA